MQEILCIEWSHDHKNMKIQYSLSADKMLTRFCTYMALLPPDKLAAATAALSLLFKNNSYAFTQKKALSEHGQLISTEMPLC